METQVDGYAAGVRSYGQYCALAKALDVVGDRWTLLIVRELLTRGPCRYTDLKDGLPGIATNLLADRLRELKAAGILARHEAPPPVAATLFELTARGRELEPAIVALACWGAPAMVTKGEHDAFRHHWLALPARHFLSDNRPQQRPQTVRMGVGHDAIAVTAGAGAVSVTCAEPRASYDATIDGPAPVLVALLAGRMPLDVATRSGLTVDGDLAALRRLLPSLTPGAAETVTGTRK